MGGVKMVVSEVMVRWVIPSVEDCVGWRVYPISFGPAATRIRSLDMPIFGIYLEVRSKHRVILKDVMNIPFIPALSNLSRQHPPFPQ